MSLPGSSSDFYVVQFLSQGYAYAAYQTSKFRPLNGSQHKFSDDNFLLWDHHPRCIDNVCMANHWFSIYRPLWIDIVAS